MTNHNGTAETLAKDGDSKITALFSAQNRIAVQFVEPSSHAPNESECADARRVLSAAIGILQQGEDLLTVLTAGQFSRKVPVVFNATIGGHYRHCLDHFTSALRDWNRGLVDYDHRDRDPRLESQPAFALQFTRDLLDVLHQIDPELLLTPVVTRCEVSYEHGDSPASTSSLGRELAYCIAHAIHHYALIAVMARLMEINLPPNFGIAPSTVAHQAAQKTA